MTVWFRRDGSRGATNRKKKTKGKKVEEKTRIKNTNERKLKERVMEIRQLQTAKRWNFIKEEKDGEAEKNTWLVVEGEGDGGRKQRNRYEVVPLRVSPRTVWGIRAEKV